VRPFLLVYKGERLTVDLPGYYPQGKDDGVVVGDDMRVVDLRVLKERMNSRDHGATTRKPYPSG